jgi:hypothetical protein
MGTAAIDAILLAVDSEGRRGCFSVDVGIVYDVLTQRSKHLLRARLSY